MAIVLTRETSLFELPIPGSPFPFVTRDDWEQIQQIRDAREKTEVYKGLIHDPDFWKALDIAVASGQLLFEAVLLALRLPVGRILRLMGRAIPSTAYGAYQLLMNSPVRSAVYGILLKVGTPYFRWWLNNFAKRTATTVLAGKTKGLQELSLLGFKGKKFVGPLAKKSLAEGVRKATNNPFSRTVAQSVQAITTAWRLDHFTIYDVANFIDWILKELPQSAKNLIRKLINDMLQGEEDMPYNRRTGQWFPSRRGYGFRRYRGFNRYQNRYPRRRTYRRTYRRW